MGVKFFRFDWSYLERLDEIEPGTLDEVRLLLRFVATAETLDPLRVFFSMALAPFYDARVCEDQGRCPRALPTLTGNVLYRLADLVPQQRRESLPLFEGMTLQDWRDTWVLQFKKGEESIPHFAGGDPVELPGLREGR